MFNILWPILALYNYILLSFLSSMQVTRRKVVARKPKREKLGIAVKRTRVVLKKRERKIAMMMGSSSLIQNLLKD